MDLRVANEPLARTLVDRLAAQRRDEERMLGFEMG